MSRSLAANFITEKNLAHARPFNSFVFHFGGGIGDIYVDTQARTIGGNAHLGVVKNCGDYVSSQSFRDGAFQVQQIAVELINFPLVGTSLRRFTDLWSDVGIEGVEVDVYQNFRQYGGVNIYQELLFKGVCRPGAYDPETCRLTIESVSRKYLPYKEVGVLIEHTDFPLADLDDVGRRMNICYGSVKGVKAHSIVGGLQFALQAAMSAVSNTIEIGEDAYNALPSTGTVQIGDEQIVYQAKATTPYRLTTLTRNVNATPLQSHALNDNVVQVLTEYVYEAAGHALGAISNVKIWRNGLGYPLTGYTTELANTTRKPGVTMAIVKVPTPPVIHELPVVEIDSDLAVQDGIAVADTIGVADTISVIDNIGVVDQIGVNDGIGVLDTIGISQANNETQWEQVGSDQTLTFNLPSGTPPNGTVSLSVNFPAQEKALSSGSFVNSFAYASQFIGSWRFSVGAIVLWDGLKIVNGSPIQIVSGGFWPVTITAQYLGGTPSQGTGTVQLAISAKSCKYNISNIVAKTGEASKIGTASKTGSTFKSGAAGKAGTAFKTGAAAKQGTVTLAGGVTLSSISTAEVVLGEYLTFDCDGYMDDGSGTWTGSANALIEKPADILHHFARNDGAIPSGYVDSAAFVTARGDAPSSYKFALCISERTNLEELLLAMGMQSRIQVDWPIDKLTCRFQKDSYSAGKAITQEEIMGKTLQIRRGDPADLLNIINVFYGRDWTLSRSVDSFAKVYRRKDTASITRYGEREQRERFLFDFIAASNDAMATDIGDYKLARHKEPPRVVTAEVKLDQFELVSGDIVNLTIQTAHFAASAGFAPAGGGPEITFDAPGLGIATSRQPEYFDNLLGASKFIVDEFGLIPGSARDRKGSRMRLVVREVP